MIFRQLFDHESYTYTYLLASGEGREAVLIEQLNLKLVFAIDTHVHADHVTALGSLREKIACQTIPIAVENATLAFSNVTSAMGHTIRYTARLSHNRFAFSVASGIFSPWFCAVLKP